jgi:hypothetical protein
MQSILDTVGPFLSGAIMMALWTIGFFFFRFWKRTRDRFFFTFATAFWVMAVERIVLALVDPAHEMRPFIYMIRLVAFMLIIVAIVDKNRSHD